MRTILKRFDLNATFLCGQVFRYNKINDNEFVALSKDKLALVKQLDDSVVLESDDCEYFLNYFDINVDYDNICSTLNKHSELQDAINAGRGIRILRQDLLETIIGFIVSANNNISRIRNTMRDLCVNFGHKIVTNLGQDYFAFPTLSSLAQLNTKDFEMLGAGYRASQLVATIKQLATTDILHQIQSSDKINAYQLLLSLKGIGAKVANCILLFGLGFSDSFPVDTWIFNSLKSDLLDTKSKVEDYYAKRYGKYCGYAQQYIFYYNRSIKKVLKIDSDNGSHD